MKYGTLPKVVGPVDFHNDEMMTWVYLPIKLAHEDRIAFPRNVLHFAPIFDMAAADFVNDFGWDDFHAHYVYLTVKAGWVTESNPGNRPGWHSDGFGTPDLNYIWYDSTPTLFWHPERTTVFSADHAHSLEEMDILALQGPHKTYPVGTLLRLDEGVIHRVADIDEPHMRTFVKVSFSREKYNLLGNSKNHALNYDWDMKPRGQQRNHPVKE